MNLSFAGCGFMGIYHVGVASCFREYAPHVLFSKIAGASVGSIAAAALICDVSLGQTTTDILSVAVQARSRTLGPLSPMFDLNQLVAQNLQKGLPPNAHHLCNGRLFISVTRWDDRKNVLLSQFNSREELIQALICSCFIPAYSGLHIPSFRGVRYVDGGLSDNLPVLDENTVTVSPFAGEHDICPQDESCNILQINVVNTSLAISPGNMYRFCRILFPPKPEILSKICQQGFDDALKFLQRKNVIACTRCLGVQSSLTLAETESKYDRNPSINLETNGAVHVSENCIECKTKRQEAHASHLPDAVVKALEEYEYEYEKYNKRNPFVSAIEETCEQVNRGLLNWFLRFAPIRWLSYLGKPYIVPMAIPVDITLVIVSKVYEKLPSFRKEIKSKILAVINLVKQIISKLNGERHLYSAKFSCQLAITEFDYTEDNVVSSYAFPLESIQPHETCSIKMEEEKVPKRKLSFKTPESSICLLPPPPEPRLQRKSYAGFTSNYYNQNSERVRRKSLTEVSKPERVIRNMKFGFTVELMPTVSAKEALKSLGEEDNELNVIELTNKALSMERDYISQHPDELTSENAEAVEQMLNLSKNEALMSYYYVDEDKSVKITELYNVTDADSSVVLPDDEREVNNELLWEKDWINLPESTSNRRHFSNGSRCSLSGSRLSLSDSLNDEDLDSSENECDQLEKEDTFKEEKSYNTEELYTPYTPTPRRKNSFIFVNH